MVPGRAAVPLKLVKERFLHHPVHMPALHALIFDLDGTLIDSLADIAESINLMLDAHGWPRRTPESFRKMVGDGMEKLVERALPVKQRQPGIIKDCVAEYRANYDRQWKVQTQPYAGIIGTLAALRKRGLRLGVISNKAHRFTVPITEHFFGSDKFDCILGQRDDVPRKPDPAAAFQMARELGVRVSECGYVGDSGIDMTFAVRARMVPIGVLWGFRDEDELRKAGAAHLLERPEELINLPSDIA